MEATRKFTSEEVALFKAFEQAGERDAVAISRGRDPMHVLTFKKFHKSFKPQRYCLWRSEQK